MEVVEAGRFKPRLRLPAATPLVPTDGKFTFGVALAMCDETILRSRTISSFTSDARWLSEERAAIAPHERVCVHASS